jgi:hypothetical protein
MFKALRPIIMYNLIFLLMKNISIIFTGDLKLPYIRKMKVIMVVDTMSPEIRP